MQLAHQTPGDLKSDEKIRNGRLRLAVATSVLCDFGFQDLRVQDSSDFKIPLSLPR